MYYTSAPPPLVATPLVATLQHPRPPGGYTSAPPPLVATLQHPPGGYTSAPPWWLHCSTPLVATLQHPPGGYTSAPPWWLLPWSQYRLPYYIALAHVEIQ